MQFSYLHLKHPNILYTSDELLRLIFFWSLSKVVRKRLTLKGYPKCVNKGQTHLQEHWLADLIADAFCNDMNEACCAIHINPGLAKDYFLCKDVGQFPLTKCLSSKALHLHNKWFIIESEHLEHIQSHLDILDYFCTRKLVFILRFCMNWFKLLWAAWI